MEESTRNDQRVPGRSMTVRAYGNTADELELMALDGARKVFGNDVQLTVVRDYTVAEPILTSMVREAEEHGAAYFSDITVRTVEG